LVLLYSLNIWSGTCAMGHRDLSVYAPHGTTLPRVEVFARVRPFITCTDSNNLSDTVTSDAGRTQDKRLPIVVAALREAVEEPDNSRSWWVRTKQMLADGLTKVLGAEAVKPFRRFAPSRQRFVLLVAFLRRFLRFVGPLELSSDSSRPWSSSHSASNQRRSAP